MFRVLGSPFTVWREGQRLAHHMPDVDSVREVFH